MAQAHNRRPIVAGNWKMNTTLGEARDLSAHLRETLDPLDSVETVLCPPFISLGAVGQTLRGSRVALGAQNCHYESKGAFTGEISPVMLTDLGCRYVILGHSERRTLFGETDELVARKLKAAFTYGLTPIVCVGENLQENEQGRTESVVGAQLRAALSALTAEQVPELVIAYEPIWAIGTGRAATPEAAQATIHFIRRTAAEVAGDGAAGALRIQYGGSVTAANAAELFAQPDIDGALVGGASLKAADFTTICRVAAG